MSEILFYLPPRQIFPVYFDYDIWARRTDYHEGERETPKIIREKNLARLWVLGTTEHLFKNRIYSFFNLFHMWPTGDLRNH